MFNTYVYQWAYVICYTVSQQYLQYRTQPVYNIYWVAPLPLIPLFKLIQVFIYGRNGQNDSWLELNHNSKTWLKSIPMITTNA